MGRSAKTWDESDERTFKSLCRIMCTKEEVCSVMCVDAKTLDRLISEHFGDVPHDGVRATYSDAFKAFSAAGRMSLRRKQFELAMEGDKAMLVWLGKNYLDQSEPGKKQEAAPVPAERPKDAREGVLELVVANRAKRAKAE